MVLHLIRLLDHATRKEWPIVRDAPTRGVTVEEAKEIMRLEWSDDLIIWMDDHEEEIEKGDVNTFLEYKRLKDLS
jgi:hypothetical protein